MVNSLLQKNELETQSDPRHQPLPVERRRDLIVSQTGSSRFPVWTIKDPVAEKFYQLRQHDYFVFTHLDGKISIAELQEYFYKKYAPHKLSSEHILNFVQHLFAQGLVNLNKFGTSLPIERRANRIQQAERQHKFSSLLAIRFRGVDPDQALERLLPFVRWCFSPILFVVCLVLFLFALSIAITEWEQIYRDLPGFESFLKSGHLIGFIATIAVIKIFHELAHATACKRFGGECHELGVMLLAFTPCLYCNVSDSWLMKSRWHRIAIAGAGIYLEIVIATLSTFIWYWTVPGTIHTISLYLMVIGSVSTIFLNGNPLLRYDGYYILSDLMGVSNLRSRSQGLVRSWLEKFFFGISTIDPVRGQPVSKIFLGLYGILSGLYIWFIIFAILWMLYQATKPYGLQSIVVILGVLILSTKAFGALQKVINQILTLSRQNRLNKIRLAISGSLALAGIYAACRLEFERKIHAPCLIEAGRLTTVFVSTPGQIEFVNLEAGQVVSQNTELAKLTNRELEREVLKLKGQVERQQKRIQLLQLRQNRDPSAGADIPSAQSSLQDYQQQLNFKEEELKKLTLVAPQTGVIVPIENINLKKNQSNHFNLTGKVMAPHNEGAWLETGTKLCVVASKNQFDAVMYVEQSEAVLLTVGTKTDVVTTDNSQQALRGRIIEISAEPVLELPPAILNLNLIPFKPDSQGKLIPGSPVYEVRVRLDHQGHRLPYGQTGNGTIQLASETVMTSLIRNLRNSINFEL